MSRCPWCGGDAAGELRIAVADALREVLPELLEQLLRSVVVRAVDEVLVGTRRAPDATADLVTFTTARRLVRTSYASLARAIRVGEVPAEFDQVGRRWRIDRAALITWSRDHWSRSPR